MKRLENKIALVTGAAGGIGSAVVRAFLAEGAKVAALDLNAAAIESTLGGPVDPGQLLPLGCDISDSAAVQDAVRRATEKFGSLHILCNNAGGSSTNDGKVTEAPEEEFWRVMRVDLFGTFAVCKYGIPELIKAGGGSVINLTSITALIGMPERDCYSAAKGGVAAMTRSMAVNFGADNVRVNAIAPGRTLTPRTIGRPRSERQAKYTDRHLLGVLDPEDIANMALFLASDESRRITGQVMAVDSGLTIG